MLDDNVKKKLFYYTIPSPIPSMWYCSFPEFWPIYFYSKFYIWRNKSIVSDWIGHITYMAHGLKGTVPSRDRKKAFFPDFFSHRKKHRRHKNFRICFSHILDFINKKISNGRVIHVLRQRLDTVGVKLREL